MRCGEIVSFLGERKRALRFLALILERIGLISQADRQSLRITDFTTEAFLLPVQRHRAVEIAAGVENIPLVAEGKLQAELQVELTADTLLLLEHFQRAVRITAILEYHALVAK